MVLEEDHRGSFMSFDDVEARLVEAVRLWRRMPGGGRWPFAGDGPWQLVTREVYGPDVDKDAPVRERPPTRAEIAAMEEASEWLLLVPEADRRLVALAIGRLARGEKRVAWAKLKAAMGVRHGADGLRMRYSRAISRVCEVLNGGSPRARGCQALEENGKAIFRVRL